MNKNNAFTIIIAVLVIASVGYIVWQNKIQRTVELVSPEPTVNTQDVLPAKEISITTPLNAPLSGDAVISGIGRLVYFEASFPAKLVDGNNVTVWQGPATAQGDWMTVDYVPFQLTIPTATIPNGSYTLVLTQDDASGELVPPALYSISVAVSIQN